MSSGRSYTTSFLTKYNNAAVSEFKKQLGELKKEMSDNKREQKELSKEIRDAQKEIKAINAEIAKTGKTTAEQQKRLNELTASINTDREALEKLKVEQAQIQGRINATNDAIDRQNKAFTEMKDSINNAKSAAGDFVKTLAGVTAAATAAVSGLFAFTSQAAKWADDINTLSKTTGIGTDELQKFMYASELIDVSVETLSGSLTKLTRNMAEPTAAAAVAFDTLKVKTTDATGALRDRQEVFYETIEALGRVANETERDALAMDIFGRSAQELNPLIKGGAQVLKELGDEAERAGLILSQETLDGLNDFNNKLDLLKSKGTAIKNLAASEMTPAFDGLLEVADELLDDIKEMAQSGELKQLAKDLGEGLKNAATALKNIIKFVWEYKDAIGAAVKGMIAFKLSMSITSVISNVVNVIKTLTTVSNAAAAATTALGASMSKLTAIGSIISVVIGLTTAFVSLSASMNDYTTELRELLATEEKTMAQTAGEAALLREQYDEMRELGSLTSLTTTQKERLASLEQTVADRLGITTQELKDQSGAYRDLTKEIDAYIDKLIEKSKYEYYENVIRTATTALEELKPKIEELRKIFGGLWNEDVLDPYKDPYERFSKEYAGTPALLIDQWREATKAIDDARKAMQELGESGKTTGGSFSELTGVFAQVGSALGKLTEKTSEAADQTSDLAKAQKDLQTQSSTLRSEMSSLANSLKQLENGQALNLNSILQLIEKYPEFAEELLNAADNADLQKQALLHLFEAKKAEYILSLERADSVEKASNRETATVLENIAKQIEAYRGLANAMGNVSLVAAMSNQIVAAMLRTQASDLRESGGSNENTINYLKSLSVTDLYDRLSLGTSSVSGSGSGTGTTSGTAASPFYEKNERGVYASGSSYVGMYTQWLDRLKSLGRLTTQEEEKLLSGLLKREENTAEERYQIEQRLYKARETLAKEAADKQKELEESTRKSMLERQNLALAAYNRLVDNKIDLIEKETKAAEESAEREIAAIDKLMQKRSQEESDEKRRQELAQINAKLRYKNLTEFERYELEQRRQEINNEISRDYRDRELENRKASLSAKAAETRSINDEAIAGLNVSKTQVADYVARLQGTQTYDQRVKNNSTQVNFNIVESGLDIRQLAGIIKADVLKALGGG